MQMSVIESLGTVPVQEWNALAGTDNPFLRHEFLAALEQHGCVDERYGWLPQHLVAYDEGDLVGAAPMYLKYNSYGEFVFDWSWAEAYQRHGLSYYPKLVVAAPYAPVTGARLLIADEVEQEPVADALIEATLEHARKLNVSSLHWLFTNGQDTQRLERHGLMRRTGCQFHWGNRDYRDFNDFLAAFSSEKRKKVKQERRRVREAGIEIDLLNGHQISAGQWRMFHEFYCSTFYRRGGIPTLTLEFFQALGEIMPEQVLLVLARHNGHYVAGAFNLRGADTLYGRHWGCAESFHGLHFECCYYRAIEYCIEHGLKRFEAGAQGEHKLARGFLPMPTYSAHWLSHPAFKSAVADFLAREQTGMAYYMKGLDEHSPYKYAP